MQEVKFNTLSKECHVVSCFERNPAVIYCRAFKTVATVETFPASGCSAASSRSELATKNRGKGDAREKEKEKS
jgi:hypothetical protein